MERRILMLDEAGGLEKTIRKPLETAGYPLEAATSEKQFIAGMDRACLVLVHCLPSGNWMNYLQQTPHKRRQLQLPVLGFNEIEDPLLRLEERTKGLDDIIATSALRANPVYHASRHARPLDLLDFRKPLPAGIFKGIDLFNKRKFHPAHDEIEPVWLKEKNGVRLLYQGILQVGIACYFIERNDYRASLKMFACGKPKVQHFLPQFLGLDVADLFAATVACEMKVRELGPARLREFDPNLFPIIKRSVAR